MSKRGYISRYLLILKKLKAKQFSTFEEIQLYFDNQVDYLRIQDDNLSVGFSKRTFQRDVKEIRNIFGIDIEYSKQQKGYYISSSEAENMNFERMIDSFYMFNSLSLGQELKPYIHLENRRPQGIENIYELLHAIKNRLLIVFSYQKFLEERPNTRNVEAYALKEFKNRWYVLARDIKDDKIKSFALDRLTNLEITKKTFDFPDNLNIENNNKHFFGILSPTGMTPKEIILSFEPFQGKYIKSLPLHDSQEILIDTENELRIRLKLNITYDFIMELLSFSDKVRVIKPLSLIKEIKDAHLKAFKLYE